MKKINWTKFLLNVIKYAITLIVGAVGGQNVL